MTVRRLVPALVVILIVVSIPTSVRIARLSYPSSSGGNINREYERFMQMTEDGTGAPALELGNSLFTALLNEKTENPTLAPLTKRLGVAEEIRTLVARGVRASQPKLLEGIPGMEGLGLPPPAAADRAGSVWLLPPARNVYWTYLRAFTDEPVLRGLSAQQVAFCRRYYDLRMQDLILAIGHQVVVADPNVSENACYALALPLLCLHGRDNDWGQAAPLLALFSPAMLDVLSRFALLQVERPQAAMAIARYRAERMSTEFSPVQWAADAAGACVADHRPDLAERLLGMVAAGIRGREAAAQLRLRSAENYAQCGDYDRAAQICERILAQMPDTSLYGRVTALRLGYLAKENKAEQVIALTAPLLDDARCGSYLGQVLYLRWWALQKSNRMQEAVPIAQRLLERNPHDPYVAPILLERATDALAHQRYDRCRELLTKLTRDFPGTESAKRAEDILARLQGSATEGMRE